MVFQCKNYSEITVETRTQLKSVIFTTDIFAVQATMQQNTISSDVVNGVLVRKDYRYGSIAAIIE